MEAGGEAETDIHAEGKCLMDTDDIVERGKKEGNKWGREGMGERTRGKGRKERGEKKGGREKKKRKQGRTEGRGGKGGSEEGEISPSIWGY